MAAIPAKDLREKTSQELQDQLLLEKKRLFDGVMKSASGESIKAHEKRDGRRLIARIQTILREREVRAALEKRIGELNRKAAKAAPRYAKLVKEVDDRVAEIKKELAKPAGKRKYKPLPPRIKVKPRKGEKVMYGDNAKVRAEKGGKFTPADRAAIRLAEAKRLRASIDRVDVGQGK